jgi:hypothetical protein
MVRVDICAVEPERVTVAGVRAHVAGLLAAGVTAQVSATVPEKPLVAAIVSGVVFRYPAPCLTTRSGPVMVKLGVEMTVRETVVDAFRVPDVPVIDTVTATGGTAATAAVVAKRVRICVPAGPAAKLAVTPVGRPVTTNAGVPVNPPTEFTVTVLVMLVVCASVSVADAVDSEKPGGGLTVRFTTVVLAVVPEVPVIVTWAGPPRVAAAVAVRVNVLELVAGLVEKDAVTPLGRPEAASVTIPVKPLAGVMVMVSVAGAPWTIVRVVAAGVRVKVGASTVVMAIVVLDVRVPEVPVTVTNAVPAGALAVAAKVTTVEVVTGFVLKTAVTPGGRPVAASVTPPLKPLVPVMVAEEVAVAPCTMLRVAGDAANAKVGGGATVREMAVVALMVPETPVIVTVATPVVAVAEAVKVTTLDPVVGLVANAAVTPTGKPVAANVTELVKPATGVRVTVEVLVEPWPTVTATGVAASVNPGAWLTVSAMTVVCVALPTVPVTVTVTGPPMAAVPDAVSVSTEEPVVEGLGLKEAVTPAGRPDAVKATPLEKPTPAVIAIVSVPLVPCVTARAEVAGAMVYAGVAVTFRPIVVVAVVAPEVPVIVTIEVPDGAVADAVRVRTLAVVVGLVANDAVTPEGRPVAASVTLPVKPAKFVTRMLSVTLAL